MKGPKRCFAALFNNLRKKKRKFSHQFSQKSYVGTAPSPTAALRLSYNFRTSLNKPYNFECEVAAGVEAIKAHAGRIGGRQHPQKYGLINPVKRLPRYRFTHSGINPIHLAHFPYRALVEAIMEDDCGR
jgi:hypothetical protein